MPVESPSASRPDTRSPGGGLSLLWRLFAANGAVLALAVLLLAVTPVSVTAPFATLEQVLVLLAGLALMLGIDLLLLRRVLSPLRRLTELMRSVDPDEPGRRLEEVVLREAEVAALARAFNDMLDRLEAGRRESARVALEAQERERLRVARELHDEIGQTLTAVTLKAERAADNGVADAREELHSIADDIRESLDDVRRIARELRPEALDDLGLVNALITLCARVSRGPAGCARVRGGAAHPRAGDRAGDLPSGPGEPHQRRAPRRGHDGDRVAQARGGEGGLAGPGRRCRPAGEVAEGTAGIGGMRERARLVGGVLVPWSERGKGTEIRLEVPAHGTGR